MRHTAFMTCNWKNQMQKYTTIHNLRGRKKRRKTYVDQGNAKVTFHNITTRTYDSRVTCRHFPTTLYFKLMTFRIEWEGLHKIMDLFLQFLHSFMSNTVDKIQVEKNFSQLARADKLS